MKVKLFLVPATLAILSLLVGCSQNSFNNSGPAPEAPAHPRAARPFVEGQATEAPSPPPKTETSNQAEANWKADGTITLPSGMASKFQPGSTIYVIARVASGKSHTVAAKKILPEKFPITFELTSRDSMTGENLPVEVQVEAWLDRDGSISTREKGDLFAKPVGVKSGDTFTLSLNQEIR